MSTPGKYDLILSKLAKQCKEKYSYDASTGFKNAPPSTNSPMLHMANSHLFGSVSSHELVQEQIVFLDCKARNGMRFERDEQEFLTNLFEAMWWGAKIRNFPEAGALANHYVNGNGTPLAIDATIYRNSAVVKIAQKIMREVAAEHFSRIKGYIHITSIDESVKKKIREVRRTRIFNSHSEGDIKANGMLQTPKRETRLFYADNRFFLQGTASYHGSSAPKPDDLRIQWRIESVYDFSPYNENPWHLTELPITHPGAKNLRNEDTQKFFEEVLPDYFKIRGKYSSKIILPDGLSNYMETQGAAKKFRYYATWND